MRNGSEKWERELARWSTPYLEAFEHKVRRRWAPVYLRGLLLPGDRKSIEPIVERVAPEEKGIRSTDPVLHERVNCLHLGGDETKYGSGLGGAYRGMGSKRTVGDGVCRG